MDSPTIETELGLLASDPTLQKLTQLLDEFNIFDAVGLTHQEIRHSTFLAFLASPSASHTMGDRVLKAVLELAGVEIAWLDEVNLTSTTVSREQDRIDILAVNPIHNLVLLIENKIYTSEHSDQLARYYELIQADYPDSRIVAIYLTRDGSPASHPSFVPISYAQICSAVEIVIHQDLPNLRPIIRETIEHYIRAVRKNIVADDGIKDLCQMIYREHKSAIDAIIRNVPARESQIYERLLQLIEETPGVSANFIHDEQWIGFVPNAWDELQRNGLLHTIRNDNLIKTGRPLYFIIWIQPSGVEIAVQVRYGSAAEQKRLFDVVAANTPPLFKFPGTHGNKYTGIYRQVIFTKEQMQTEPPDKLIEILEQWWDKFIAGDFAAISKIFVDALGVPTAGAPVRTKLILAHLTQLIAADESIVWNHESRYPSCIGFLPGSWDKIADKSLLYTDLIDPWMRTGRLLFFQFGLTEHLEVVVQMRYGSIEQRERLLDIVNRNSHLMRERHEGYVHKTFGKISCLYQQQVLSAEQLANPNIDVIMSEINEWWQNFMATDYKAIEQIFLKGLANQ